MVEEFPTHFIITCPSCSREAGCVAREGVNSAVFCNVDREGDDVAELERVCHRCASF